VVITARLGAVLFAVFVASVAIAQIKSDSAQASVPAAILLRVLLPDLGRDPAPRSALRGTLMDIFEFLEAQGIVAERRSHPPVMTVEESLRLVPKLRGLKTKNLFLRDKRGRRHLLVTVPHDLSVDLDALGLALDAHRLGFASAERLSKHLGIRPGSVSLLALFNDKAGAVEFVIDRRLWDADAVQAHPLVNSETLVLGHADLERFLAATGHWPRVIDVPAATMPASEST
jgi:Ala-tRNA(Pro) deacylase